ncbi:unnamed protein product [Cuscuta epithymum]|uniref:RING-type domain-containing protein n=1 Tax=Cuscuta epithymum TaxID=186058 RepID=A0AAV0E5J6_9ASTE|nr:unnamed protein product [Cuscuta epithymum]
MAIQADYGLLWNNVASAGGANASCFSPPPLPQHLHFQLMDLPLNFAITEFDKQKWDTDRFIYSQNERLKAILEEQRKEQLILILRKFEAKTKGLFEQKDEEIAAAMKRTAALEAILKRLEIEKQTWQMAAKEREATASFLVGKFERLRESMWNSSGNNSAEDATSSCGGRRRRHHGDGDHHNLLNSSSVEDKGRMMICKRCNVQGSCLVFLPCRHLCSCKSCEALLDSCPICKVPKKACIEAYL